MKNLTKDELLNISAGAITASYISALARTIESLLELGRSLGTAIRRWSSSNVC